MDGLLRRHYGRIYAICRRLAGNDADAKDATQEALLGIVRGLDRFDGRAKFTTWAYRVATNACLDELRRRSRRPHAGVEEAALGEVDDAPSLATSVSDRLDLDDALSGLPGDFRAAVVLRDQLGMDYAEIAQVLEIPPGTVRSRIARGRRQLADALSAGNREGQPERPTGQEL